MRFVNPFKMRKIKWVYERGMKNLSQLNRDALIKNTQCLVAEEKRIELELLDHLREIPQVKERLESVFQRISG